MFLATPPLEGLKLILGAIALEAHKGRTLLIADMSRAFFYAPETRQVYADIPEEDAGLWKLECVDCDGTCRTQRGTPSRNWQAHVTKTMHGLGFASGLGLHSFVHGDDFVTTGSPQSLKNIEASMTILTLKHVYTKKLS